MEASSPCKATRSLDMFITVFTTAAIYADPEPNKFNPQPYPF
jgi:hypothetical protein